MLNARWQNGHLGEQALVCRSSHDLMKIAFGPGVWADDYHCGTQEFDEVPARTRDGEDIYVVADVPEEVESGVMLEQKKHFHSDPSNVLEHVTELHVFRI